MVITDEIRAKLLLHLPDNYRQIIALRVGCHPNTVGNVLLHGNDNLDVALALLKLAEEEKLKNKKEDKLREAKAISDQL